MTTLKKLNMATERFIINEKSFEWMLISLVKKKNVISVIEHSPDRDKTNVLSTLIELKNNNK